jgi:hypothetical protein
VPSKLALSKSSETVAGAAARKAASVLKMAAATGAAAMSAVGSRRIRSRM